MRYCHTSSHIYNNLTNDFWVYAVWEKGNGIAVNSGLRHLDGRVDENFDAATFRVHEINTGRGNNPDEWIQPTSKGARICVESMNDIAVSIYTTTGLMSGEYRYESGQAVMRDITSEDYIPGTYVIMVQSGDIRKSKKIIIR